VTIKIRRDDKEQEVAVTLGEVPKPEKAAAPAPGKTAQPQAPAHPSAPSHESKHPAANPAVGGGRGYLGLRVGESDEGVVVQSVIEGGPAANAGIQVGEVITNIGDSRVSDLSDLDTALRAAPAGRQVAVGLRGEKGSRSLLVTMGRSPGASEALPAPAPVATAPLQARSPEHPGPAAPAYERKVAELEVELATLRAELADLRKQLDALRQSKGRE
jgi:hypothetical protein